MLEPRRIGLFGGSFDPVHLGHIHLANTARTALDLDQVRFLPCTISPHKTHTSPATPEQRAAMLRIATRNHPWAVVDLTELARPGPSYSYQTAETLHHQFPNARLFWILGGDQWNALPTWQHPQRLAQLVEFIVLARGPQPQPRPGMTLHLIPGNHPASATAIRHAIQHHNPTPWLDPHVANWIKEHRLYQK